MINILLLIAFITQPHTISTTEYRHTMQFSNLPALPQDAAPPADWDEKVHNQGVPISKQRTRSYYRYDEAMAAFENAIALGDVNKAIFFGTEIFVINEASVADIANRVIELSFKLVGPVEPKIISTIMSGQISDYNHFSKCVALLATAKKSRANEWLLRMNSFLEDPQAAVKYGTADSLSQAFFNALTAKDLREAIGNLKALCYSESQPGAQYPPQAYIPAVFESIVPKDDTYYTLLKGIILSDAFRYQEPSYLMYVQMIVLWCGGKWPSYTNNEPLPDFPNFDYVDITAKLTDGSISFPIDEAIVDWTTERGRKELKRGIKYHIESGSVIANQDVIWGKYADDVKGVLIKELQSLQKYV